MAEVLELMYRNVRRMDKEGTSVIIKKTYEDSDVYRGFKWLPSKNRYALYETDYVKRYWILQHRGTEEEEKGENQ